MAARQCGDFVGYSLMLDGLTPVHAQHLMEQGLGPHRLWGCGLFIPHKPPAASGKSHAPLPKNERSRSIHAPVNAPRLPVIKLSNVNADISTSKSPITSAR